ncbi:hypothetical protein Efla_003380 [Eimeria flavescens]
MDRQPPSARWSPVVRAPSSSRLRGYLASFRPRLPPLSTILSAMLFGSVFGALSSPLKGGRIPCARPSLLSPVVPNAWISFLQRSKCAASKSMPASVLQLVEDFVGFPSFRVPNRIRLSRAVSSITVRGEQQRWLSGSAAKEAQPEKRSEEFAAGLNQANPGAHMHFPFGLSIYGAAGLYTEEQEGEDSDEPPPAPSSFHAPEVPADPLPTNPLFPSPSTPPSDRDHELH